MDVSWRNLIYQFYAEGVLQILGYVLRLARSILIAQPTVQYRLQNIHETFTKLCYRQKQTA